MAKQTITQATMATNNIQAQADQVINAAAALKLAFDQFGIDTKTFINNSLISQLEATVSGASGSNYIGHNSTSVTANNVADGLEEIAAIAKGSKPTLNVYSLLDYGAVGDGVDTTNNYQAFVDALSVISADGGGVLVIPYGDYIVTPTATINIPTNTKVFNFGNITTNSETVILFTSSGSSNSSFIGGTVTGTGTNGAAWLFYLSSCDRFTIDNVKIRDASSSAINMVLCTSCTVKFSDIQDSYFYAIADKYGTNNYFLRNTLSNNGYGASTTGRGITIWMGNGSKVQGNEVSGNNEYGIRTYTEVGDTQDTKNIIISGNTVTDNAKVGIHVYGTPINVNVSNNIVTFTSDSTATAINVSGTNHTIEGNTLAKPVGSNGVAFVMYDAHNCKVLDNNAIGFAQSFSWSGTALCSDCNVENNKFKDTRKFMPTIFGAGHYIAENTAEHAGTPVFGEDGIKQADASAGNSYINNRLTGFHTGYFIEHNVRMSIIGNIVRDSGNSNIRSSLTDFHNIDFHSNDFDDFAYSGYEILRSLQCNSGKYLFVSTDIPSTGSSLQTFAIGDRAYMRTPIAGGNIGWTCVTAGTPGTWKTFGNIGA